MPVEVEQQISIRIRGAPFPTLNLPINPANPDLVSIAIAIAHVTNEYRAQNGKTELAISTPLSNAAQMHANYTRDVQSPTHTNTSDPTKRDPKDRAALFGVTGVGISENAIQNFAVQYVGYTPIPIGQKLPNHTAITLADAMVTGPDGWKFSPGHNTNMLRASAKAIGCGVAFDTDAATKQVPYAWAIQKFSF